MAYDPPVELIWIEQYPNSIFYLSSDLFEVLMLKEGLHYSLTVKLGDRSQCDEKKYCFEILK